MNMQKFISDVKSHEFKKNLNEHMVDGWEIVPNTLSSQIMPQYHIKGDSDHVYGYHCVVLYKYIPMDLTESD